MVLTLYFLASLPSLKKATYNLAPASRRERVSLLGDRILRSVGGYVSGAFVVATCAGLSTLIFLFIVGSFTPVAMVSFNSTWSWLLLSLMWGSGIVGIAIIWLFGIRTIVGVLYIVLGWAGLFALAPFLAEAGVVAALLLCTGGLCYTVGALASRFKRPNPWPAVFGYHEVFHAMTVIGAICQYAAVTIAVSRPV